MDSYFPKTRRPTVGLSSSLKRPPPSVTPPRAAKIPSTPTTPKDARLARPLKPPPVKRKCQQTAEASRPRRPMSVKELFGSAHPHDKASKSDAILDLKLEQLPTTPKKISAGPLKGVSTSLIDIIRAKEAASKALTPEQLRTRELLGIAPEIVRIIPTVFIANKKEIMPYDVVVEKCFQGLKSNYTSPSINECIELMDKVAPEWISTVQISRGKFMRINKGNYTIPQLLEAIRRYKKTC